MIRNARTNTKTRIEGWVDGMVVASRNLKTPAEEQCALHVTLNGRNFQGEAEEEVGNVKRGCRQRLRVAT